MAKILNIEPNTKTYKNASLTALKRGDFYHSIKYLKLINNENKENEMLLLAENYTAMKEYRQANKLYFKLLDKEKKNTKLYLNRIVDNLINTKDYISVLKYIKNYDCDFLSGDIVRIEQLHEVLRQQLSPKIDVAYPPNDRYFAEVLGLAGEKAFYGEYEESNRILRYRDYTSNAYYKEAIRQIAYNYIQLNDISGLIQYCYKLIATKHEGYARMYLVYCYNRLGFYGNVKVNLDILSGMDLPQDLLLELTKILGNSLFNEENLLFVDKLLCFMPYSAKVLVYKAVLKYILGYKKESHRLINKVETMYGESKETYLFRMVTANNHEYVSPMAMADDMRIKAQKDIVFLSIDANSDDFDLDSLIKNDNKIKYLLHIALINNDSMAINILLGVMTKYYSKEVRKVFEELLIDNELSSQAKILLIKQIVNNDNDTYLSVVYDNFFVRYDYGLSIDSPHITKNMVKAYYEALFMVMSVSINPIADACYILQKYEWLVEDMDKKGENPLKNCDYNVLAVILCYNENSDEFTCEIDALLDLFGVTKRRFNIWYKKYKEFTEG